MIIHRLAAVKCRLWTLIFILAPLLQVKSAPIIQNIHGRNSISLNGKWSYLIDRYEVGYFNYRMQPYEDTEYPIAGFYSNLKQRDKKQRLEYEFSPYQTMNIPGDWNTQLDELKYYEGTVWFQKDFQLEKKEGKHYYLYFGAVNYEAIVYVNGKRLGTHIGGFTAFNFDVTDAVEDGNNFVVVKVDNTRKKEAIPTVNTDWWNYGGITRDVLLTELPETFISDYQVQLNNSNNREIKVKATLQGIAVAHKSITLRIPELKIDKSFTTNEKGELNESIISKKIQYWSPESPKLYELIITQDQETIHDKVGFRTIETRGSDILLNGKPVFLRGISIHEENPLRGGRANGVADARMLLGWAKDLNCNFVRLAHYPHNEYMVRMADEMGLLVWSEIPVYWTIDWTNTETYKNAAHQLQEMIARDKNRASIIIWSIGNETPITEERLNFMGNLAKEAHHLDDSRLVSAALEPHNGKDKAILEDPLAEELDVMSFNEYIGWYGNTIDNIPHVTFEFKYNKPVIVSELGAGALAGFHGDRDTMWSEELQAYFYEQQVKLIQKHTQIKGMTPWILVDFRSPRRMHPRFQDGWNRKGLISNNGQKKMAFKVLQEFYQSKESKE